jgi:hypothetical protein
MTRFRSSWLAILKPKRIRRRRGETVADAKLAPVVTLPPRDDATALRRFLLALPRAKGESESLGAIYARYLLWCQHEHLAALDVEDFRHKFEAEASRLGIHTRKQKNKVLCLDVKLAS